MNGNVEIAENIRNRVLGTNLHRAADVLPE